MSRYLKLGADLAHANHDQWLLEARAEEVAALRAELEEAQFDLAAARAMNRFWVDYSSRLAGERDRARETAANFEAAAAREAERRDQPVRLVDVIWPPA